MIDVMISLGFGEFIKLGEADIVGKSECLIDGVPGVQYDFRASTKTTEYLPYGRWFWEELADDNRFSPDNQIWLEIGDLKIPLKSIKYERSY